MGDLGRNACNTGHLAQAKNVLALHSVFPHQWPFFVRMPISKPNWVQMTDREAPVLVSAAISAMVTSKLPSNASLFPTGNAAICRGTGLSALLLSFTRAY